MTNKSLQFWNEEGIILIPLSMSKEICHKEDGKFCSVSYRKHNPRFQKPFSSLNEAFLFSLNFKYFSAGEDITDLQNSHIPYFTKSYYFLMTFNKNILLAPL